MKKNLYKVENGLGVYWVIAEHPTDAENKLLALLNKADYGYFNKRKTISITVIAEEVDDIYLTDKYLVL